MSDNAADLRLFLEASLHDVGAFIELAKRGEVHIFDPNVVYEDSNLPDHTGEAYHGYDGVLRAATRWVEGSDWIRLEHREIVGDGDHLVSVHELTSKAEHTGIEFAAPLAYAWTFRDGRVIHFRSFRTRDEALSAAGLSESAGSRGTGG